MLKVNEYKQIIKEALKIEYGFAPAMRDITFLEANSDGTYIYVIVNNSSYKFRSHSNGINGVWVGKGTIEKL